LLISGKTTSILQPFRSSQPPWLALFALTSSYRPFFSLSLFCCKSAHTIGRRDPQFEQNLAEGRASVPHTAHTAARAVTKFDSGDRTGASTSALGQTRDLKAEETKFFARSMIVATAGVDSGYASATAATLFDHSALLIHRSSNASLAFSNALLSASSNTNSPSFAAAAWASLFFNCFVGTSSSVA
jgi:hypothetical protein